MITAEHPEFGPGAVICLPDLNRYRADWIAAFGGSWRFILIFLGNITVWMILNSAQRLFQAFDKHPFILLNLALSCLAALQAPVIMMRQRLPDKRA